ncbi:hypothetical protein LX36DRAFT_247942 [Colletotrichum falcatum]|nr:hypothetical protein LX36DRAFT_247942 [Colletotrichum falcatum]
MLSKLRARLGRCLIVKLTTLYHLFESAPHHEKADEMVAKWGRSPLPPLQLENTDCTSASYVIGQDHWGSLRRPRSGGQGRASARCETLQCGETGPGPNSVSDPPPLEHRASAGYVPLLTLVLCGAEGGIRVVKDGENVEKLFPAKGRGARRSRGGGGERLTTSTGHSRKTHEKRGEGLRSVSCLDS